MADAVRWQVAEHAGYVRAYISSLRYRPAKNQYEDWNRIGKCLTARKEAGDRKGDESTVLVGKEGSFEALREGKVLVIAGEKDNGIIQDDIFEEASAAFEGNIELKSVDAGHELSITKPDEIVGIIWAF